ncbi:type II secretion system F family protein [Novipirellula artificiosorum]|uniref:Bacterial type II secretion system protein F domain protein n=1 Tax=Novipirellula artificiosorum TaxID=2528016 RepID=A0A5C6D2G8_9BACT|nr:type II secretion system F family protein [Novipirellula artificiosorum]TWU31132.1 Bacterial type II secretion system protein F domain protein [Novipirellula artificiosorum]
MMVLLILAVTLFVLAGATLALRRSLAGASAGNRLGDSIALLSPTNVASQVEASSARADRRQIIQPLSRPLRFLPYMVGALISLTLGLLTSIPISIVVAIGMVIALLLAQLESGWHAWRLSRIERQLIDLLDMMIPMLRSGAGASAALAAASEVTASPLRDQINWCVRRIQLGDSGSSVFRELSRRMPIDVMELFATTMSVHWETGGSLAPVLASVGRVARDRQEVARRIRSNIAQSQFSTIAVLLLIYFVALVLWLDRPDVMKEFASSSLGSAAIAATIVLQAVGIVWMNAISRPKA